MRLLTSTLPGTGGALKTVPEDFVVEELPAYPPSGEGAHTFVLIEKRALTTDEAVRQMAAALGVDARDAGWAGTKDRQAIARQWISLPNVDPARAKAIALDGVRVLEAARHGHKLRTGHLRGNRFTIVVRGATDGVARARAILEALAHTGAANWFGAQRFGSRGDNASAGRALLDGKSSTRDRSKRRLLISAYQSHLFNHYLDARIADDLLQRTIIGDVLKKTDTGGLFTVDEAGLADAQARLDGRALVVTGPMFGHKMMRPPDGTAARAREDAVLAAEKIDAAAFASLGRLAEGTRRPLTFAVADARVERGPAPDAVTVAFTLPPGAYATIVLAEITKATDESNASSNV